MKRSREFLIVLRGLIELHNLHVLGEMQKNPRADEIRTEMDGPYMNLSGEERTFIEQLSKDLYELEKI